RILHVSGGALPAWSSLFPYPTLFRSHGPFGEPPHPDREGQRGEEEGQGVETHGAAPRGVRVGAPVRTGGMVSPALVTRWAMWSRSGKRWNSPCTRPSGPSGCASKRSTGESLNASRRAEVTTPISPTRREPSA